MFSPPHTVAVVIGKTVSPFDLAVPCEVFGIDRSDLASPWYRFFVASSASEPTSTQMGFSVDATHGLHDLRRADSIVIPAAADDDETPTDELLEALRRAHRRGARIMSVCSGAFVLAAAGLLDGRRATTHWMHTDRLACDYPLVQVDPSVLYVDEGDILTSAGTAAGSDMCLHVVRHDFGAEVANAVARRIVVPPHRDGGQAQFIETPLPESTLDDPLSDVLEWMQAHVAEPASVEDLARRCNMSRRNFARRFKAGTGTTPVQWLLTQRIFLAQRLLESTDLPIDVVAEQSGFGSTAALRFHFARITTTSPHSYRRSFQSC